MIPTRDIEKFFAIVDREISLLELRENMNPRLKASLLNNWIFIRNTFRRACIDCAEAEGILKKNDIPL